MVQLDAVNEIIVRASMSHECFHDLKNSDCLA